MTGFGSSLFMAHAPRREVVGHAACGLAIKEVEGHQPVGSKVLVGKW